MIPGSAQLIFQNVYGLSGTQGIANGGTGYTIGDTLTLVGGTLDQNGTASVVKVATISGGGGTGPVDTVTVVNPGDYDILPVSPVSTTGGSGTGAEVTPSWSVAKSVNGMLGQFDLGEYAHTYQTTMDLGQYLHTIIGSGTLGQIDLGEYYRVLQQPGTLGRVDLEALTTPYVTATFSPVIKFNSIILSKGNLSAISYNGLSGGVLSTVFKSTGAGTKHYCEFTMGSIPGGFNLGIATSSFPWGADSKYIGITSDSYGISPYLKWNNNANASYGTGLPSGTVIGMLFDTSANTLAYTVNGVSQGIAFSGLSGTFCPAVSTQSGTGITANFGGSGWAYTPPAGYVGWY